MIAYPDWRDDGVTVGQKLGWMIFLLDHHGNKCAVSRLLRGDTRAIPYLLVQRAVIEALCLAGDLILYGS
jgi:hypothetical protein